MMKVSKLKALGAAILSFVVFCSMMPVAGFAAGEEVVVPNNDNSKMIHVTIPNSGPGPDAPEPEQKGDYHLDIVTSGATLDIRQK